MKILITGSCGTGKSSLSSFLNECGLYSMDADHISGLGKWLDKNGKVGEVPFDAGPEYLKRYKYFWDLDYLEDIVTKQNNLFFVGVSSNALAAAPLFDRHYFLDIDTMSLKERLDSDTRLNRFGKTAYQQSRVLKNNAKLAREARKANFTLINATQTVEQIAAFIMADLQKPFLPVKDKKANLRSLVIDKVIDLLH